MRNPTRFLLALATLCIVTALSYREAQADNHNLIVQTTPTDCGPAALATLLHYYLAIPATEHEMVRLSGATPAIGTSLMGLQKAAQAKGCAADSFRMNYQTLQKQLSTFAAPVIVNLANTQPHFAVVLEAGDDHVFLADPAFGNIALRKKEFLRYWASPVIKAQSRAAESTPAANSQISEQQGFVFVVAGDNAEAGRSERREMVRRLKHQLENLRTARPPLAVFRR